MGHRLSSITTRTGDGGDTGLGDGSRVPKDHLRVQAMGDVDELNSSLGILLTETMDDDLQQLLTAIQHDLFDLGGELSIPGYRLLKEQRIAALDQAIGDINQHQSPLKEFILPGGARSGLRGQRYDPGAGDKAPDARPQSDGRPASPQLV